MTTFLSSCFVMTYATQAFVLLLFLPSLVLFLLPVTMFLQHWVSCQSAFRPVLFPLKVRSFYYALVAASVSGTLLLEWVLMAIKRSSTHSINGILSRKIQRILCYFTLFVLCSVVDELLHFVYSAKLCSHPLVFAITGDT